MKITAIAASRIPSANANGIQVMKACHALAQQGHQVRLLVPLMSPPVPWDELARLYRLETRFEIEWLSVRSRRLYPWVAAARAGRPDLLYAWPWQAAVAGLLRGVPVVFEAHEPPTGRVGPLWAQLFYALPGRKTLVSITRSLANRLETRFGQFPGPVVIAPNGVDLGAYTDLPEAPAARAQLGLPQQPTVLCSGHLYAGRGVPLFVELAKRLPEVSFLWVGGREKELTFWRQEAAGLTNLRFVGFKPQSELPLWQAAADVLTMPYERRIAGSSGGNSAAVASPMKMFDYMAARRAILSSDLPVIREVLDETCARFAPPEDPNAWESALRQLLAEPHTRQQLAAAAFARVQNFTWQARAKRILEALP